MSNIQTGSNEDTQVLTRRIRSHRAVPGRTRISVSLRSGRHRAPRQRTGWKTVLAALGVTALALGSCGTPAPAAPVMTPAPLVYDWTTPPTPKVTPAAQRRIEVVDRLAPAAWRVGAAAEWLDRYTASNMVLVPRCSGKAYRCITVRGGKLPGRTVGWAKGTTITIDTAKVARSPYRSATYRQRLLSHELAHTFGLHHAGGRNLMATTVDRMRLSLTTSQRAYLRAR